MAFKDCPSLGGPCQLHLGRVVSRNLVNRDSVKWPPPLLPCKARCNLSPGPSDKQQGIAMRISFVQRKDGAFAFWMETGDAIFSVRLHGISNFHPLEVMGRGSETQLQVSEKSSTHTLRCYVVTLCYCVTLLRYVVLTLILHTILVSYTCSNPHQNKPIHESL